LDSVSGRNAIYRAFADEYIAKNKVKCINGKLRKYKDGIYPESDEDIDFIKTEIMKIGLSHGVNLADNNITATLKMIENSTRVRIEDCEPDRDDVIVVNNGILNLKTWELEDFSEDKVYFSKLPVDYLPNAPKPEKFLKFIEMAFKDNQEQGLLAQEFAGYTLLKNYKYQAYFYLLGSGVRVRELTLKSYVPFLESITCQLLLSTHSRITLSSTTMLLNYTAKVLIFAGMPVARRW
jgi:putative DNA primase/helicase